MATIDITKKHSVGKDRARETAEHIAKKLKDQIQVDYHWDGDDLRFERKGAKGRIHVADDLVRVEVDLSLVLRPMKGMVEGKIHDYLDRELS